MKRLELVPKTSDPAWQLACDEAMLEWSEMRPAGELLRLWEPAQNFVVLGVGNRAATEADLAACQTLGIPVLRRCSGGGAVLQAPGCLNISLILRIPEGEEPLDAQTTHQRVLTRHKEALDALLGESVDVQGTSDLVMNSLKFSGNAQRRKRRCVLYHGTFLFEIDLNLMEKVLRLPSRQPAYRQERPHRAFLTKLPPFKEQLRGKLVHLWEAHEALTDFPTAPIDGLVEQKYSRPEWNLKL
jgi:lipoate---protein ligase